MTDVSSSAGVDNSADNAASKSGPPIVQTGRGRCFSVQAPLVTTLLVLLTVELITHRIALPIFKPGLLEDPSTAYMYLAAYSPFFYNAACLSGVAALCWTLIETMRDHRFAPLAWRILLGFSFCVFMPMATVGSMVASSLEITPYESLRRLLPYLNISFIIVILVIIATSWTRSLKARHRVALLSIAVPVMMLAVFQHRMFAWTIPNVQAHAYDGIDKYAFLLEYGSLAAGLAGFWLILLLAPDPVNQTRSSEDVDSTLNKDNGIDRTSRENSDDIEKTSGVLKRRIQAIGWSMTNPFALATAMVLTVTVGVLLKTNFTTGQKLVETAMGVSLPAPSFRALFFLVSFFLIIVVIVNLFMAGPEERLSAAGLSLMVLGGYRLNEPLAYLSIVLGLLCISKGAAAVYDRDNPAPFKEIPLISDKRWKQYVLILAESLSKQKPRTLLDSAWLNTRNTQVSRIFGDWFGSILDIRFVRKSRNLTSIEFTLGEVPSGNPDWSISRKPSSLQAQASDSDENDSEIPICPENLFAAHFQTTDKKGLGEKIFFPGDHKRCIDNIHGDVSIWWGIGLRHRINVDELTNSTMTNTDVGHPVPLNELALESDSRPSPGGIPAIVNLLTEWAERAGITDGSFDSSK